MNARSMSTSPSHPGLASWQGIIVPTLSQEFAATDARGAVAGRARLSDGPHVGAAPVLQGLERRPRHSTVGGQVREEQRAGPRIELLVIEAPQRLIAPHRDGELPR